MARNSQPEKIAADPFVDRIIIGGLHFLSQEMSLPDAAALIKKSDTHLKILRANHPAYRRAFVNRGTKNKPYWVTTPRKIWAAQDEERAMANG